MWPMALCWACLLALTVILAKQSESSQLHDFRALHDCEFSVPLGMISGEIEDWQLSASSTYPHEWDAGCHERYARLYQHDGRAWCARYKTPSEWLQVDLGVAAKITGAMTQGRGDGREWVTSFMISHSMDAFHWKYIADIYGNQREFEGNTDSYAVKAVYFDSPVVARFIKFHTVQWHRHPSLRVEIIGCQVCKSMLTLPPFAKVSASTERASHRKRSCSAVDGHVIGNKAWCARDNNENQWLQFDVGPATLVTGLVTKGRGDSGKNWVTKYRVSFGNDSQTWYFYKDASHLDPKEFGGNVDRNLERYQYLNSPFVARYVRFQPVEWQRRISMRAAVIGCPYTGKCPRGFLRVSDATPCVENLSYQKESWINSRRQRKRHVTTQWHHGHASRAVDGDVIATSMHRCVALDNFYVERPTLRIDFGRRTTISGLLVVMWNSRTSAQETRQNYAEYTRNVQRLDIYVDSRQDDDAVGVKPTAHVQDSERCGSITRLNEAMFQTMLHLQCVHAVHGRYLYIEAVGVENRWTRLFSAVVCEVLVYQ